MMIVSLFTILPISANAEAVTPKYKITVTSGNASNKSLSNSTALPFTTTAANILNKLSASAYTPKSVSHNSGSNICTFSGTNVTVNQYGSEKIAIIVTKDNKDYKLSVTINMTALTSCVCEATGYTGTYDGEAHTIENLTVTSPESGATIKYGTASGTYDLTEPPSFTEVGTHTVYYQVNASGWVTKTGSVNVVINPKPITITWKNGDTVLETDTGVAEGATPTYDGETPTKDGVTFVGWTDSHGVFYAKDAALPEVTADETYTAVFELTIGSVDEWNSFAASVKGGNTYSGITVRMTADVGPVTTMVDGTFSGTFDGEGHTLTVNISGGSTSAATFAYVKDATIQNLRLEGTVTSSGIHTAALVKAVSDTGSTCTIKNVDIYADVNCSQGYIGGFIGHAGTANTVNIENSIFAGSINKTGSTQGFIGAFIGWSQKLTATINNCAFTGSYNNINSFNNIGFSYNAPTKVTVSGFYSNASEVFVANVNHGTRLYVPSSSYPNAVALVKNNDGETFYSAFSDALAAWTDGSTLALLADVTCDSMISVPANTSKILDLNGKTLTTVATNTVYGTLTIQSTVSGGNIIHTHKSQVISVQEEATLNINSGTIHGYNADRAVIGGAEGGTYNLNGGKIVTSASNAFSIGSGSTLNLNGGEIECTSGSTGMGTASAVWAHGDSTINWNCTAITTNTGDGIRMKSAGNGTVNVTGGSFTATSSSLPEEGGYAIYCNSNMGTLNLEGNPSISGRGIYLADDKVINITNDLSNTNPISVTMQTPGVFTSGLSGNGDASNFANGNGTGYALTLNASGEAQIVSTHTVTWKNWNGDVLETDENVAAGSTPTYNGATPVRPEDMNATYTFSAWDDDTTTYLIGQELPPVTGDVTYKAVYTADIKKLFVGHTITLGGDIGVNFFIDSNVAGLAEADTAVVKFAWDGGKYKKEVNLKELTTDDRGWYKVTVNVVAAQMAHKIEATAFINGNMFYTVDMFSVQDYAEAVYAEPGKYLPADDADKAPALKALAAALLHYGSEAQTVFDSALYSHPDRADSNLDAPDYSGVTVDAVAAAINGDASDLDEIAAQLDAKFFTSSLIYLQNNTLRLYFTPASKTVGGLDNVEGFTDNLKRYYYYADHANIAAAELDNQQEFTVGGVNFNFSALDYVIAVLNSSKMNDVQKNLAKALFQYNQAANDYFDEPVIADDENIVDLSTLTAAYEAQDGDVLTGELQGNYQISIADGATVTLRGVDITRLSNNVETANFAGITPLGDATIMLEGENTVKGGYEDFPGVFVPVGKTLTIDGTGSLNASSIYGCGIGGGYEMAAGNIVINGGTITANGGPWAAGIGSGFKSPCGNITINGGTVAATGGENAAGIGGGWNSYCGDITIAGTVTSVIATKGDSAPNSIGAGFGGTCSTISIADPSKVTQN